MAIATQVLRWVKRFPPRHRLKLTPGFPILPAALCAMAVASCAENTAQNEIRPGQQNELKTSQPPVAAPVRRHVAARVHHRPAQPRLRRLEAALLTPQPAPDCDFNIPDVKSMDPDQWANLKLDYERRCYQNAEKVARERLALLQKAVEPMVARK